MTKLIDDAKRKEAKLKEHFYNKMNFTNVEKVLGYEFQCKTHLVTALMHKSFIDQSVQQSL
jgi:hypothetical protein